MALVIEKSLMGFSNLIMELDDKKALPLQTQAMRALIFIKITLIIEDCCAVYL